MSDAIDRYDDYDPKRDDCIPVSLREDGLLWLINSTTFHPRGFALGITDGGRLVLFGDGSEPWRYGEALGVDPMFDAVEALLERARQENKEDGS